MGSSTFHTIGSGNDARLAFREAREDAKYDHGHGGYSGSIAEKDDYVVIQPKPVPQDVATRLANDLIDQYDPRISDKWGPAGAIAIGGTEIKNERTLTLTVENPDPSQPLEVYGRVETLVREQVELQAGEHIKNISVRERKHQHKTSSRRTGGQAVTRYFLKHTRGGAMPKWETGYDTVAEARAEMDEYLKARKAHEGLDPIDLEIIGMTRREDGSPLAEGAKTLTREALTVDVEIITPEASAETIGWLFFGWASD